MDRFERKKARLHETQATLKYKKSIHYCVTFRAKVLEYKLIKSLNSSESFYDKDNFNFVEDIVKQKSFEELLVNLENFEFKLPSREFKNFLKEKWSNSLTNIREEIQIGTFSSIEDVKLSLAALLFNMNINLSPDDTEERSKLIDAYNSVIQIE
jgi:hypothetical protein